MSMIDFVDMMSQNLPVNSLNQVAIRKHLLRRPVECVA